jgi:hypothetical protein
VSEIFSTKDGRFSVCLFEKHTDAPVKLGAPPRGPIVSHCVEFKLRDAAGNGETAIEIDLLEFHEFMFRKIFPSVARRIQRIAVAGKVPPPAATRKKQN